MTQTAIQTYVQALYQNVLLRAGDSGGVANWTGQAEQGMSSMTMVADFIGSTEAQNITAVLRLYDVFFNRAADSGGLTHWAGKLHDGGSLRDLVLAFAGSDEFQAKYGTLDSAAYVDALYDNLFDRAADAGGKAHWIAEIDSGRASRAELALVLSSSAEAKASDGAATRFAESYLALRSSGVEQPSKEAVEALAQKSLAEAIMELQTVHGTVQNGIIQDAHVSRDGDGDGHPDAGAHNVTTDANGNFTIVGGYGDFLVSGGTDLTTGNVNDKTLSAPGAGGAVMVTPLTTLIKAIVDQGVSVADAVHKVNLALGLDANFDPLTFDHTANATAANSTQAQQKEAIAIKGAIAQITTLMENVSGLIKGAAGAATDLDVGGISTAVAHALAGQIIAATGTGNAGSPLLALGSADVVKATITAAASGASADSATPLSNAILAKIGALSTDAANMIGALNTVIGATVTTVNGAASFDPGKIVDAFSTIAKAEALGQDTVQAAITSGAHDGSLTGAAASYTGEHLNTAIKAQTIGTIADGVASTSGGGVITQVTGTPTTTPTTGGGDTPPPATTFTLTETAGVVQFAGTATGDITVAWTDGVATFSRGGKTATTTADFGGSATKITLASGQNLVLDAAHADGKTINGAGTVGLTGAESLTSDLSHISAPTTLLLDVDMSVAWNTALPPATAGFQIASGATLSIAASKLAALAVSGAGNLTVTSLTSNTDLSHVTVTGKVLVTTPGGYPDIHANTHLGVVDEYHVIGAYCSGFTLTADQASHDVLLTGESSSYIMVEPSAGNQTVHINTEGKSTIELGTGADQLFLGGTNGHHTVVVGVSANQTEQDELCFYPLAAGQSVTVAGLTLTATGTITSTNVAAAFANLAAGADGTGVTVANGTWSGTLAGWHTTGQTATVYGWLSFVSETANTNVADIALSTAGTAAIAAPTATGDAATQGAADQTEEHALTFHDMVAGQSVTVAGLTLTATGAIAAADVATGFENLAAGADGSGVTVANGTWSGTLSDWYTYYQTAVDGVLSFVSETANANVDDIALSEDGVAPTWDEATQGAANQTEEHALTFHNLIAGQSVTVAGLTLTATGAITAANVAAAFENLAAGDDGSGVAVANGAWSGTLTDWNTTGKTALAGVLSFVSETANANVDDIVVSEAGTASIAAPPKPYDEATQGYAASPTTDSTPLAYDVITGFTVGNDHLRLPASGVLTGTFDATATGVANLTIERASVGAYETFAGIKSSMSTNDTISFTYDSQSYTVTLSNGITNLQADIDAAAAVCAPALGANHVAASFVGDDLVLTAVGDAVNDTLVNGMFSNPDGVPIIPMMPPAPTDASDHAAGSVMAFGGTAAATASVLDKAKALLTAMGSNQDNAVFVAGNDTYVVEGDGVAGMGATDIMVKLAGVQVTDFTSIYTHSAYIF